MKLGGGRNGEQVSEPRQKPLAGLAVAKLSKKCSAEAEGNDTYPAVSPKSSQSQLRVTAH